MPFTASQLTTFYTNANFGITPTAAEALLLQAYASQNQAGVLTDAQTISDVLAFSQDKTDVALATYQFFTGSTPTAAGLAFLIHGGGNPNDLSSAYYAGFNKENRYYNFAINLALDPASSASASFATAWGPLNFAQAVQVAYEQIVGTANVGQTQAAAAEAAIIAAQPFFQSVAASRAPQANQDLAVKAIMIGYILEEAQKADVGIYAKGIDQLMSQLAQTGTANFGNLLVNYPATPPGQSFTLTTGVDNIVGTSGTDTITGTDTTVTGLDKVDGGNGADVLNLNDVAGNALNLAAISVTNVETLNLNSLLALKGGAADVSGFTGLTTANINLNNVAAAQAVTAAATTAVNLSGSVTVASNFTVNGGSADTITVANGAIDNSASTITVNGAVGTSSATVVETVTTGKSAAVVIQDAKFNTGTANTITSVSLSGLTDAGATINSDGLTSLTVQNSKQNVTVNAPQGAATRGLSLTLNKDTAGTISDATAASVAVTSTGSATSGVTLSFAAAKSMSIGGTASLTLAGLAAANVSALTLNGSGAVTANLSGLKASAAIDATASKGVNTLTLGAAQSFAGGGGGSVITETADVTAAVSGGGGSADELILGFNAAGLVKTAGNVSNFELLGVGAGSVGTYDVSKFTGTNAITALDVAGATAGAVTFSNVAPGIALNLSADPVAAITYALKDDTGSNDSVTINVATAASSGLDLSADVISVGNIENVTINSLGKGTAGVNKLALTDAVATTLTLTGAESLTLTGLAGATVNSINATGMGKGVTLDVTGITLSTKGTTFTGGAGNYKFTDATLAAGKTDIVTAGDGNSVITDTSATSGAFHVTLGNGVDTVNLLASTGNNIVTLGNASSGDTVQVGNGNNTIVSGSGADLISFGSGLNVVTGGSGADHFVLTATPTNGNIYTTITDWADKGDNIDVSALDATAVKGANITGTLGATATFQDYLDQAAKTAGAGHVIDWFQFNGDTYLVDITSAAHPTFAGGADFVVKLSGVVDPSTAAFVAGTITHA